MAQYGSLIEVQTQWSIDDLFDAHEALDVKAEMEAQEAERIRRESRTND